MHSGMSQTAAPKSNLSPEAISALGKVSVQLAWTQIRDKFQQDLLDHRETCEGLAKAAQLPTSLDALAESLESRKFFPPVSSINHLVESSPDLSLRDIPHLTPLTVMRAILHMRMTNQAYL